MATAWIFPGQGSQVVGMADALSGHPDTAALFERASGILGWSVAAVCAGPQERLDRTLYTQPALFTVCVALAQRARKQGELGEPALVAGHSLGEYAALWAAAVFDFETGLELVAERARLMDAQQAGAMSAIVGFDRDKLEKLCAERPGVVIANDNNPMQVVISGEPERVAEVSAAIRAKRVIPLAVSGAFHSPLMAPAAAEFAAVLARAELHPAHIPVLFNADPTRPVADVASMRELLRRQIDHPVRWRETILRMADSGITELVEIGPGAVLTGLAKRTVPALALRNIEPAAALAV
ncbi:ACP S-malonyltransferase [Gloeobacter violaceus]|uniref:Malonyl CoA-acyl carrier protein transacylase n=1 Tax=Gloeobacter violaceus (strain ATCC 29082 / PCC 7421) TaxID=251221 RepID=Q7NIN8_GLOVI|nr:ACP S-malonyltransferase [Gloeobacter violaceus]BAC90086.1 malonyl coenzyme A-acyl carrier protein transacylase [Gloeobacter violaceus PCC 7421]